MPHEHLEPTRAAAEEFGQHMQGHVARGLNWIASSPRIDYTVATAFARMAMEVERMGKWLETHIAPRLPVDAEETPT